MDIVDVFGIIFTTLVGATAAAVLHGVIVIIIQSEEPDIFKKHILIKFISRTSFDNLDVISFCAVVFVIDCLISISLMILTGDGDQIGWPFILVGYGFAAYALLFWTWDVVRCLILLLFRSKQTRRTR